MNERRVHLIDDDEAMRDSLSFLLSTQGIAVTAYDSPITFLSGLPVARGGCIVTDLRMPEMSGLQLVRRLKELGETTPVIVITGHGDVSLAVEAMKAGVVDFIEKPFDDDLIVNTINEALERSENAVHVQEERAKVIERLAALTGRERDVMEGLVAGRANKVIADDLGISARTVEIYRANVMAKMQVRNLSELVRLALLSGQFH